MPYSLNRRMIGSWTLGGEEAVPTAVKNRTLVVVQPLGKLYSKLRWDNQNEYVSHRIDGYKLPTGNKHSEIGERNS
jgi:hypothetical protein